jgi:hypothetical protein
VANTAVTFQVDTTGLDQIQRLVADAAATGLGPLIAPALQGGVEQLKGVLDEFYTNEHQTVPVDYTGAGRQAITGTVTGGNTDMPEIVVGFIAGGPSYMIYGDRAGAFLAGSKANSGWGSRRQGKTRTRSVRFYNMMTWFLTKKGSELKGKINFNAERKKSAYAYARKRRNKPRLGRPRNTPRGASNRSIIAQNAFRIVRSIIRKGTRPHPFIDKAMRSPQWDRTVQSMANSIEQTLAASLDFRFAGTRLKPTGFLMSLSGNIIPIIGSRKKGGR